MRALADHCLGRQRENPCVRTGAWRDCVHGRWCTSCRGPSQDRRRARLAACRRCRPRGALVQQRCTVPASAHLPHTAQWRAAVIGPHRTDGCAAVILGNDRHHPIGREHLKHFVVVGLGKRPTFNDAGVTCHLDDERVIVRRRRAKHGAPRCHRQIVADALCRIHPLFCRAQSCQPTARRVKVPLRARQDVSALDSLKLRPIASTYAGSVYDGQPTSWDAPEQRWQFPIGDDPPSDLPAAYY
jgi:hypothetical protein